MNRSWPGKMLIGFLALLMIFTLVFLSIVSMVSKTIKSEVLRGQQIALAHTAAKAGLQPERLHPAGKTALPLEAAVPEKLIVFGADGSEIYRSEAAKSLRVPSSTTSRPIVYHNGSYFIYEELAEGVKYVSAVDQSDLRKHYQPVVSFAVSFMAIVLTVCLTAFFAFNRRFLVPVRQIVSLTAKSGGNPTSASLKKNHLQTISRIVSELVQENRRLVQNSDYYKAAVMFDYMNLLNRINPDVEPHLADEAYSYTVVLYDIRPNTANRSYPASELDEIEVRRMLLTVREAAEAHSPSSCTLQLEPRQIVTVYPDMEQTRITAILSEQRRLWKNNPAAFWMLTIAVSDPVGARSALNDAYAQARGRIEEACAAERHEPVPAAEADDQSGSEQNDLPASKRQNDTDAVDSLAGFVLDTIRNKYDQDLSLNYFSDLLGMSSTYLSTYIKEKTGRTFSDHLHHIRVGKAQEMLITTGQSINDIAVQVGYINFSSFTRMFKKQTGLTPGEYRKKQIIQIHRSGLFDKTAANR